MKTITIAYSANPVVGNFCSYVITYNFNELIYRNGLPTDVFQYVNTIPNNGQFYNVLLGANLNETINNTMLFFSSYWQHPMVNYERVNDTIVISFPDNYSRIINLTYTGTNITITTPTIGFATKGIIYFLEKEGWRLDIYKNRYKGITKEVFGTLELEKGSAKNSLDPIRGTGLNVELEADLMQTFDDLSTAQEGTYTCILKKDNVVKYRGVLKPDGIWQSYTRDRWLVNISFVDGLGLIKDLSFVQNNGLHFVGKMSCYDIIRNALKRTGLTMTINSSCRIKYLGYTGTNILKDTYLSTARFVKDDKSTIMSCEEVIKSVLDIFSLVITQEDGQWWIYRLADDVISHYLAFTNNSNNTIVTRPFNVKLGSQIDGYFPHHSGDNQQIMTGPAVSAYTINYKYGFITGYVNNKNLDHDAQLYYADWGLGSNTSTVVVNNPQDLSGVIMLSSYLNTDVLTTISPIAILTNDVVQLVVRADTMYWKARYRFEVKRSDGQWLDSNGTWVGNYQEISFIAGQFNLQSNSKNPYEWTMTAAPVDDDVTITIVIRSPEIRTMTIFNGANPPTFQTESATCEITYIDLLLLSNYDGKIGENHSVQLKEPKSSFVKENVTVYNGDSLSILFEGAIYKQNQVDITDLWTRNGKDEQKPILRISAEDDLRISQGPVKIFTGGVYGYLPYMTIVQINNIDGYFTPIEWRYDIFKNTIIIKLAQCYSDELNDVLYNFTYQYQNTIKPTIVG